MNRPTPSASRPQLPKGDFLHSTQGGFANSPPWRGTSEGGGVGKNFIRQIKLVKPLNKGKTPIT